MKLPLEEYLFTLTRTRYLAAAAPSLTGFEPDGRNAAYMVALPDQVTAAFGTLTGHFNTANAASGTLATCFGECHDLAVAVYTSLKASYRKDQGCTRCIRSLPKQDRSPERTLARMKGLAVLWPTLPNVPGTSAPLKVGGTTAAAFGTMTADFETKVVAAGVAEAAYSRELVKFHRSLADGDGFVSSALVQGRSLYKPGTPERALIDRVPTVPDAQAPGAAGVTRAEAPGQGAVHLEFGAAHATSFQVRHQGPGETAFTLVAEVLLPGDYAATGLAAGEHRYQIVGVNSRGEGPASDVVSVTVTVATVPEQAQIGLAESPAEGTVHLTFDAEGATGFHVLHQGPGAAAFALVATLAGVNEYTASGLSTGLHEYKVRGLNAQGLGAESAPAGVEVVAAQAA